MNPGHACTPLAGGNRRGLRRAIRSGNHSPMPIRTAGFRIARILGIPIYLDPTWLLIFGLITYQLSKIVFPGIYPRWTQTQYWSVGVLTSLLFFGSVLFHELAHSVVALY